MGTASIRALVVDDYELWRAFVAGTLKKQPELEIIGQVSDGLEAVQQAQQLQPDLILLDIGLPTLNGIEAARRIRKASPTSKILFVTENYSPDIAAAALGTGAGGYVVKSDAATELLPAVEAVLQGRHFVSARIARRHLDLGNEQSADHSRGMTAAAPPRPQNVDGRQHEIAFYSDDAGFVDGFARFIEAALKTGHAVVVMTTESHRANIVRRLHAGGLDVAVQRDHFIVVDVADSHSTFMVDVADDPVRLAKGMSYPLVEAVSAATNKNLHVAVG